MMRSHLTAVFCLAAIGLVACNEQPRFAANSKICTDFKAPKVTAIGAPIDDGSAPVDECVRRWAYSLASSRDTADAVSKAVVAACNTSLSRWNRQAIELPNDGAGATSLTTGEPTTPIAEHNNFTHNRALLYAVQARAGACTPPPATNGVPDGVS